MDIYEYCYKKIVKKIKLLFIKNDLQITIINY